MHTQSYFTKGDVLLANFFETHIAERDLERNPKRRHSPTLNKNVMSCSVACIRYSPSFAMPSSRGGRSEAQQIPNEFRKLHGSGPGTRLFLPSPYCCRANLNRLVQFQMSLCLPRTTQAHPVCQDSSCRDRASTESIC